MRLRSLLMLAGCLAASPALAHTGLGDRSGFGHGFAHPVSGVDHVLAMVSVGVIAAQLGGRALWLLPLAFMSMMVAGGAIGIAGLQLPFVETGIALSLVAFGFVLAFRIRLPAALGVALVGFFALFHGHAHGAEMPEDVSGLAYAAGFVLATLSLHGAGIALGSGTSRLGKSLPPVVAASGGGVALAGVLLLANVI